MKKITVAFGDGIGPEIMQATLDILKAAKAPVEPEIIEVGEKIYHQGFTSGIPDSAWESIYRTKTIFKAPITTPQGKGYKSLNVTLRKALGLYANVRPCKALYPFVNTHFPLLDIVIIRENEEDLYAGIEYQQTQDTYQCLKIITRTGCERIVRYAFEYAKQFGRKKVTCMSKDNIMKMTDGILHQVFNEIATEYPDIQSDHYIIDIGTALIASRPEKFDVIVTSNLYGDIISDVAAQLVGSVGLAGSSNIGTEFAMFEAIHGSAPDIAGKQVANPSGLINAAVLMLVHLGLNEHAKSIQNAWLTTIEQGIHTSDIYSTQHSTALASTKEFTQAVITNLGKSPKSFSAATFSAAPVTCSVALGKHQLKSKRMIGVDVFFEVDSDSAQKLPDIIQAIVSPCQLTALSSRGVKIWPNPFPHVNLADLLQARFEIPDKAEALSQSQLLQLLQSLTEKGLSFVKVETLCEFDGNATYSKIQGQ